MELAEDPFTDKNVKRMQGRDGIFRKRLGDYGAIFFVEFAYNESILNRLSAATAQS